MDEQNILTNEESIEDVGGYIIANAQLDGYEEEATEETQEETVQEDVDLSIFDELDKTEVAESNESKEEETTPPPGFEKFQEDFKKYIGFDVKEAMTMVQELQSLRAEIVIREQENTIKTAWQVDDATFSTRMNEVRSYAAELGKKNPDLLKKLDNPEGVKLIWAKLEQEKTKQRKAVPTVQQSGSKVPANAKGAYDFTNSQIQKMSREEYARNAPVIARAFQAGRVDMKR